MTSVHKAWRLPAIWRQIKNAAIAEMARAAERRVASGWKLQVGGNTAPKRVSSSLTGAGTTPLYKPSGKTCSSGKAAKAIQGQGSETDKGLPDGARRQINAKEISAKETAMGAGEKRQQKSASGTAAPSKN